MEVNVSSQKELEEFGKRLGSLLRGGESIELVGDVGAGKTTLTKAIAQGMGIPDDVSSPSYTLSQVYESTGGLKLVHYDFYRLDDPGILANDLQEVLSNSQTITILEWADIVTGILPLDHLQIRIIPIDDNARRLDITTGGDNSSRLAEQLT